MDVSLRIVMTGFLFLVLATVLSISALEMKKNLPEGLFIWVMRVVVLLFLVGGPSMFFGLIALIWRV